MASLNNFSKLWGRGGVPAVWYLALVDEGRWMVVGV